MSLSNLDLAFLNRALDFAMSLVSGMQEISTKVDDLSAKVDLVLSKEDTIGQKEDILAADLSQLMAAVQHDTDVDSSAITLLNGLKSSLDAAIANLPNPADLQALSQQLGSNADALAAAVTANTPAENPPPATP